MTNSSVCQTCNGLLMVQEDGTVVTCPDPCHGQVQSDYTVPDDKSIKTRENYTVGEAKCRHYLGGGSVITYVPPNHARCSLCGTIWTPWSTVAGTAKPTTLHSKPTTLHSDDIVSAPTTAKASEAEQRDAMHHENLQQGARTGWRTRIAKATSEEAANTAYELQANNKPHENVSPSEVLPGNDTTDHFRDATKVIITGKSDWSKLPDTPPLTTTGLDKPEGRVNNTDTFEEIMWSQLRSFGASTFNRTQVGNAIMAAHLKSVDEAVKRARDAM